MVVSYYNMIKVTNKFNYVYIFRLLHAVIKIYIVKTYEGINDTSTKNIGI